MPNKSAKVAPAKDERRVRGGDWEVEVGSSAIVRVLVLTGGRTDRCGYMRRCGIAATVKRIGLLVSRRDVG